jgi:hypothetical protein
LKSYRLEVNSPLSIQELRAKYPELGLKNIAVRTSSLQVAPEPLKLACETPKVKKKAKGPKRPLTAYMYFMKEKSQQLMKSKGLGLIEATKLLGQMWKDLKNKKKYENLH